MPVKCSFADFVSRLSAFVCHAGSNSTGQNGILWVAKRDCLLTR
jgi:hypothetical protein